MHCVYLIRSLKNPDETYIGYTLDLRARLKKHNSGGSTHTERYRPWELILCLHFKDQKKAMEFEKYLKSGSGIAFAKKRFWS